MRAPVRTKEEYEARKNAAEAEQDKQRWWFNKSDPMAKLTGWLVAFTGLLVIATVGTIWVLKKTDDTLRAGQRAFVFVKRPISSWTAAKKIGDETVRSFYIEWENNGNSQAQYLKVTLWCPRPSAFDTIDPITADSKYDVAEAPRLLGPKQSVWGGVCNYKASELTRVREQSIPMFIAAKAVYSDIFGEWHVTEFCTQIVSLQGDFESLQTVPTNDLISCPKHNCADDECKE
jgi:hypothetical protein